MLRVVLTVAVILVCGQGSQAATSAILKPVKQTGEDAGLIFIPGAFIKGEAYTDTARSIQKASGMRLWVALTGNYTGGFPEPIELPKAVESAMKELQAAGMQGDNFVGVAHSLGGVFLASYAPKSSLKAVVLLGAYLSRGTKLRNYTKPVLTLSGELDGQTRITRIAIDYAELQQDVKSDPNALYRTPVINIKGSNHAQFASGPMPFMVKKYDLKAEISDKKAHEMIGLYVSSFVTANLCNNSKLVAEAKKELAMAFKDSWKRFQPLLNVRALDGDGEYCPWAVMAQEHFTGAASTSKMTTNNKVLGLVAFLESKPSIGKDSSGALVVNTTARLEYELNPMDMSNNKVSPKEVDIKMKSYDAIQKALKQKLGDGSATQSCKDLNMLAMRIALLNSTSEALARYFKYGRPITFGDDIVYGTGFKWAPKALQMTENDKGLHIQGVALYTSTSSFLFPGMHYCKVISPYRAMEWVNVDSLRSHKP